MSADFNTRLARMADAARAIQGGEEIARGLLRLAVDMDAYLEMQRAKRHEQGFALFQKWSDFLNESVQDTQRYYEQQMEVERRRIALSVAADPRWQGGYADALLLVERKEQEKR